MQAPVQQRSLASLERLLKVTSRIVRANAFSDTSVNRICAEAGLTSGAFYARFSGKDELLLSLWERVEPEISQLIGSFETSLLTRPLRESVHRLFLDAIDVYGRDGNLIRELTAAASRHRPLAVAMRGANERNLGRLAAAVLSSDSNIAHPQPALAVSLGLACTLSALREFALDRILFEHSSPLPSPTLAEEMTRLFLSYLEC